MADCTNNKRKFPSEEANICCPCSIERPLRLVSAGMFSRSKGSKARRAMSIGDMEVVSTSLVWASTDLQLAGRQPVGQRAESFRRLVEPQAAEQFGHLRRVFHPGRLPGHARDQVRLLPQAGGQRARQPLRPFGLRGAEGDHQFPGVGEMLLVKLQALHRRLIGRQQIEDIHVKAEPPQPEADRHEQQAPTTSVSGTNSRREKAFQGFSRASVFQPPAAVGPRSKRNGGASGFPVNARIR